MGVKDTFIYEECIEALRTTFREEPQDRKLSILEKMAPVGPKEKKLLKKMIEETNEKNN